MALIPGLSGGTRYNYLSVVTHKCFVHTLNRTEQTWQSCLTRWSFHYSVLPTPRLNRGIGLLLTRCRWPKIGCRGLLNQAASTVNVISMGIPEIGLLTTRAPRFWRCLRHSLANSQLATLPLLHTRIVACHLIWIALTD